MNPCSSKFWLRVQTRKFKKLKKYTNVIIKEFWKKNCKVKLVDISKDCLYPLITLLEMKVYQLIIQKHKQMQIIYIVLVRRNGELMKHNSILLWHQEVMLNYVKPSKLITRFQTEISRKHYKVNFPVIY